MCKINKIDKNITQAHCIKVTIWVPNQNLESLHAVLFNTYCKQIVNMI